MPGRFEEMYAIGSDRKQLYQDPRDVGTFSFSIQADLSAYTYIYADMDRDIGSYDKQEYGYLTISYAANDWEGIWYNVLWGISSLFAAVTGKQSYKKTVTSTVYICKDRVTDGGGTASDFRHLTFPSGEHEYTFTASKSFTKASIGNAWDVSPYLMLYNGASTYSFVKVADLSYYNHAPNDDDWPPANVFLGPHQDGIKLTICYHEYSYGWS